MNKKLDKILSLLEIIHPKKSFTVKKADVDMAHTDEDQADVLELVGKKKKVKKAAAKKKVSAKKAPAKKKVSAKKAPAKKKRK